MNKKNNNLAKEKKAISKIEQLIEDLPAFQALFEQTYPLADDLERFIASIHIYSFSATKQIEKLLKQELDQEKQNELRKIIDELNESITSFITYRELDPQNSHHRHVLRQLMLKRMELLNLKMKVALSIVNEGEKVKKHKILRRLWRIAF